MFLSSLSLEDLSNPVRAVFFVTQRGCCSDRQVSFLNSSAEGFFRRTGGGRGGRPSANAFAKASFVRLFRKISAAHIRGSFTISERRTCVVVSTRLVDKMPERPRGGPGFIPFDFPIAALRHSRFSSRRNFISFRSGERSKNSRRRLFFVRVDETEVETKGRTRELALVAGSLWNLFKNKILWRAEMSGCVESE